MAAESGLAQMLWGPPASCALLSEVQTEVPCLDAANGGCLSGLILAGFVLTFSRWEGADVWVGARLVRRGEGLSKP